MCFEVWKLVKSSSQNPASNIQIANVTSSLAEDCNDSTVQSDALFRRFLSGLTSTCAKELISYELSLFSEMQMSEKSKESDDFCRDDFKQLLDLLKGIPANISQQLKFSISLSHPFLFFKRQRAEPEYHFQTLTEALPNFPDWYVHYLWNRVTFVEIFMRQREECLDVVNGDKCSVMESPTVTIEKTCHSVSTM